MSKQPGRGRRILRHALRACALAGALTSLASLTSCASAIGAVAAAGVITIGVVTHKCYDYLDVTVYDSAGRKTCDADVFAERDGDSLRLTSCYYTPLGDGTWTLRAHAPGAPDVTSTVIVDHTSGCVGHVQSAALTLGAGALLPQTAPPPLPVTPTPYALPPPPSPPPPAPPQPTVQPRAPVLQKPAPVTQVPAPGASSSAAPPSAAPAPAGSGSSAPPSAAFPALPAPPVKAQ